MAILVRPNPSKIIAPSVQEPATPAKKGGIRRREPSPVIKTDTLEVSGELAEVIAQIKGLYSPAVITRANSERVGFGRAASGILSVDLCLAGGLMFSRGSMIYGNKSAGKSTLTLRFIASVQRMFPDMFVVYVDIEGTFDPAWAVRNGVILSRLHLVEPETGESAVDMADALLHTKEVSMLVTDSIAFLTPMKEIQGSAEDSNPGVHARLMGNYLRRLNTTMLVERHRGHYPLVLHINQFRMSIGVMFGDPRVLPGGKALEFATTQQIEISNKEHTNASKEKGAKGAAAPAESGEKADKNTTVLWNEHSIKITKDKSGGRYKEGQFKLIRDEATGMPVGYVDQTRSIISHGITSGILEGAANSFGFHPGADINFKGKFAGAPAFSKFLLDDYDRERAIVDKIVQIYRKRWQVT
jgi:protein RecA